MDQSPSRQRIKEGDGTRWRENHIQPDELARVDRSELTGVGPASQIHDAKTLSASNRRPMISLGAPCEKLHHCIGLAARYGPASTLASQRGAAGPLSPRQQMKLLAIRQRGGGQQHPGKRA